MPETISVGDLVRFRKGELIFRVELLWTNHRQRVADLVLVQGTGRTALTRREGVAVSRLVRVEGDAG